MLAFCPRLSCAILLCWCAHASAALVNPDFKVSSDVPLDSLSATAGATNFLTVWRDLSAGSSAARIQGALVSTTGVASPAFNISDAGGLPSEGPVQRSRVAFDGTNFLTVWADSRTGSGSVRAALITQQGAVVGSDFLVAKTSRNSAINPQVVFSGSDYFVAWSDASTSGSGIQIYYTRVLATGIPGAAVAVTPVSGHVAAQQLEFLIRGSNSEVLIVYQDTGISPNATYALRIDPANAPIFDPSGTKMFTRDFSDTGAGVPVGGAFYNNEYLLLTSRGAQIDSGIGRAWLGHDGSIRLATAPIAIVPQGITGFAEDDFPLAFFNGSDGSGGKPPPEFIFPRNARVSDVVWHEFLKRVTVDGIDRDPNVAILDTATSGGLNGAVAVAIGNSYFICWMDGRRRVADPPFQTNVFGVIVDASQDGNELRPYIRPSPLAAPLVGVAPMTVSFGFGLSTGQVDSVTWTFGDGASDTLSSTTHAYKNAGTYIAVYSLSKSGLHYNNFLKVYIESTDPADVGALGGPPQSVGGEVLPPSAGVSTEVLIDSLAAQLDFAKPNNDTFRINGALDPTLFPVYYPSKTFTAKLGSKTYSFQLSTAATFTQTATKPSVIFSCNPSTGLFSLTVAGENLQADFAAAGANNETVSKKSVAIPISVSFEGQSVTESITGEYTATAGTKGKFNYLSVSTGFPSEGWFRVFIGSATEKAPKDFPDQPTHDFTVSGNMRLPNGQKIVKASSGIWHIELGNYTLDIPTSQIQVSGDVYNYKPSGVTTGILQFVFNNKTGLYVFVAKALPAYGLNPSGMPPLSQGIVRADMSVSVSLDLDGGGKFQGGGYLRLKRGSGKGKKWVLR